jgi:hypothetical protein
MRMCFPSAIWPSIYRRDRRVSFRSPEVDAEGLAETIFGWSQWWDQTREDSGSMVYASDGGRRVRECERKNHEERGERKRRDERERPSTYSVEG